MPEPCVMLSANDCTHIATQIPWVAFFEVTETKVQLSLAMEMENYHKYLCGMARVNTTKKIYNLYVNGQCRQ